MFWGKQATEVHAAKKGYTKNMNNINSKKRELSPKQREDLLSELNARFEKNMNRHKGLDWAKVKAKLEANAGKLWSLNEMERTGGEPDVVGHDKLGGALFGDRRFGRVFLYHNGAQSS